MKKIFLLFILLTVIIMPVFAKQNKTDTDNKEQTVLYMNLNWWQNYKDDFLIEHLKKLYESNYDLKNADLKVKENEKLVKIQFASELPSLSTGSFIGRDFRSSMQQFGDMRIESYAQNNFQFPLTMSYEIDIWGKNRLKTKLNKERLEISKQAQRAAYIALSSDFAAEYFNLIKADKLLNLQNELISIQKEIIDKVTNLYDTGICHIEDVLDEQKFLTVLNEERNNLEEKREVLINNIKVYLADNNDVIERKSYEDTILLQNLPLEISSEIIENRPDYIQSEANIRQSGYDVRIARKELLPSFTIFGQIGLNAYSLSTLFNRPSQMASAGVLPVFDFFAGGRKKAFLQFKKYQYEEALNNYHKNVLNDIKEVNLGLFNYKTSLRNYDESQERLKTQDKLHKIILDKKEIGTASELTELYSLESDIIVKKEEVSNKINCLISSISLYKSVGGKNLYELNENL